MKMRKSICILLAVLCLLLTACGAKSVGSYSNGAVSDGYYGEANDYDYEYEYETPAQTPGGGSTLKQELPENHKWVITMKMDVETEDFDGFMEKLSESISSVGGFVENQSMYNGGYRRSADLTVRVPADQVDTFQSAVAGMGNVTSSSKNLDDITLRYVATESRMEALKTEESRLLELMAQAENMSDLLQIESRLTDVRASLESVTSQLRVMNNQVDYATVYIDVEEVRVYTPVAERTLWERIRDGFVENLHDLREFLEDLLVWFVTNLPSLIVFGLFLWGLIALGRRLGFKKRRKAVKSAPNPEAKNNQKTE